MRAIDPESKQMIEFGMGSATDRLIDGPNSPLNMAMTTGLVFIKAEGDEGGFHFVSDVKVSDDFAATGLPPELLEACGNYFETLAASIRLGKWDALLKPFAPKPTKPAEEPS